MTPAERARRLSELIDIGIALTSEPDLSRLLERILTSARRFTGAEAGSLLLRDGDRLRFTVVQNDVLVARAGEAGMRGVLQAESLPLDHGSLGAYVAASGEVVNVPDVYAIPADRPYRFNPEVDKRTRFRTQSLLGVPLKRPGGEVLGVLQLINARDRRHRVIPFDPGAEDLVRSLASHAAAILENARLLADSEARQRSATALAEVGRLLSQTLDVERVGREIVDSVRSLVAARSAVLFSLEPESGNLVSVAASGEVAGGPNVVFPPGAGAVGRAVREREPVTSVEATDAAAGGAVLAVPLLVRSSVIGALSLADRAGRAFTPEEIRLAQAFAHQAAIALDNARLFRDQMQLLVETRRQHQEAIALETVAREITSSLKEKEILQRIVEHVKELCQSDLAVLARFDRGAGVAHVVAVAGGQTAALASATIVPGASIEGLVLDTGELFETGDYPHDARRRGATPEVVAEAVEMAVVVPLRFRHTTTGLLLVANRTRRPFTHGHAAVLGRLAQQAAISIENARLYEEAQQQLRQTETLLSVNEAVGSTLDVTEVVRRTVRALVRAVGADMGGAWLVTEDRERYTPIAGYGVPRSLVSAAVAAGTTDADAFLTDALTLSAPYFSENSQADPRVKHAWLERVPHRSILVLPVRVKDEVIGGVIIVWTTRSHALTEDERRVVTAIARQAGVALENARLLQHVEHLHRQNTTILESAGDGIYGLDRDGVTTFANAAACTMTGWTPAELVGQPMHPLVHHTGPDGHPRSAEQCPMCAVLQTGVPQAVADDLFWRKDGTSFSVEYVAAPIVERGEIAGAVITFRDITERKRSEQALREAEMLRTLAGLARTAAHEINNPLNVVRAHLQLLRSAVDGKLIAERITPAIIAVDRIHEIVRRLNRVTRIELFQPSPGLPEMLSLADAESPPAETPGKPGAPS